MERMLRIMQCFSGNTLKSLDEIALDIGVSKRSIFRYIDTFKNAGFVVNRIGEAVVYLPSTPGCGMSTYTLAREINLRKDGKPVTSEQV